ncbi:MAG: hypothetical protein K1X29_09815, partial [Bdellovibrionales bacterium]|nr:hypothetical protein [Bdellovibrionales bacterium]
FHQRHKPLATLLVGNFPVAKESFGGVYVNSHQEVQCFSTQPVDNPNLIARHFTGFMIVQPEIIQCVNKINSNIFYDVFQKQINLGKKILAYENTDPTISFEVGNEADYLSTTAKFLSILSLDGPLAQTLRKILQKYSPSWEEGWIQNSQGTKILSQTSLPDHVKVEDFIVAGKEILFSNPITLSRCVVNHHYTFKTTEQSVHDRFLV